MRIAIITQPLMSNYGGLLQNWALQTVLQREYPGANVVTFDQVDSLAPLYLRVASNIKHRLVGSTSKTHRTIFDDFREKHINATTKARSIKDFIRFDKKYSPDAYIVGSDQVWRPSMVFNLYANFLSFTTCAKKIAYAASFGVDSWEFTSMQTERCRRLIKDFAAVSVREKDGIRLCSNYLGCTSQHVLDPTLLLYAEDYESLFPEAYNNSNYNYAFTYILDTNANKQITVKKIIGNRTECNAAYNAEGLMVQCRPSVEEWLTWLRDAEVVICDSFHGVAFSIIFNKSFYVLENPQRGNSRINSLLYQFGLEDRIVNSSTNLCNIPSINWMTVNNRRRELIEKSINFLRESML